MSNSTPSFAGVLPPVQRNINAVNCKVDLAIRFSESCNFGDFMICFVFSSMSNDPSVFGLSCELLQSDFFPKTLGEFSGFSDYILHTYVFCDVNPNLRTVLKRYAAEGDAALKTGGAPALCRVLTWKTSTNSGEHEKKKNQTWKLIYLLLRDRLQGYKAVRLPDIFYYFLLFFFMGYTFTSLQAEPPFEGILPAEHRVVDFQELSASHFKEPVPFNL